jgi:hypothetical protein
MAEFRKIDAKTINGPHVHAGTGPIFMLCWPLYTRSPLSPLLAASVPLLASLQFALVGKGVVRDDALVTGVSVSLRKILFY